MRRILVLLVIIAVAAAVLAALWIFRGRQISSFIDRYWTVEIRFAPIQSIAYEGSGTGGILTCDSVSFSLNDVTPGLSLSLGSTKDNQLALASSGKVFPFGPLKSASEDTGERLVTAPPPGDHALVATRHSVLSWPTRFDMNLMTGQSPSWKRHIYYEIVWKKSSGANLQMLWRYEQFFYPGNGWAGGFMTREGSTGLIRVEIKE
ncbi:MAG: hypothetical protein DMF32_09900 [Verrucomicrobia bacterium]|nr:MAG: hypothetical protein DMF32_09900 [Verrucomicrobiota bacterium]